MIIIKVKQVVAIKKTMKQVRVVKIKNVLEMIKNKVMIVQKIIFMIVRERVLLATPGHRDKDWMPPYSSTTEKFQSCNN